MVMQAVFCSNPACRKVFNVQIMGVIPPKTHTAITMPKRRITL